MNDPLVFPCDFCSQSPGSLLMTNLTDEIQKCNKVNFATTILKPAVAITQYLNISSSSSFCRYLILPATTSRTARCSRAYMRLRTLGANQGNSYTTAGPLHPHDKLHLLSSSSSSNNNSSLAPTAIPMATWPSTPPAVWTAKQGRTCLSHL